ncbi:hypothetical protein ACLOJK_018577 [Asimina triloba]
MVRIEGGLLSVVSGSDVPQCSYGFRARRDEGAGPLIEGSLALIPYQSREQEREERRPKKKRRLTKEEEERLASKEEANF